MKSELPLDRFLGFCGFVRLSKLERSFWRFCVITAYFSTRSSQPRNLRISRPKCKCRFCIIYLRVWKCKEKSDDWRIGLLRSTLVLWIWGEPSQSRLDTFSSLFYCWFLGFHDKKYESLGDKSLHSVSTQLASSIRLCPKKPNDFLLYSTFS